MYLYLVPKHIFDVTSKKLHLINDSARCFCCSQHVDPRKRAGLVISNGSYYCLPLFLSVSFLVFLSWITLHNLSCDPYVFRSFSLLHRPGSPWQSSHSYCQDILPNSCDNSSTNLGRIDALKRETIDSEMLTIY